MLSSIPLGLRRRPDVLRLREQEAELVMKKDISSNLRNAASIRTASVHSSQLGEAVCSQPLEAKVQQSSNHLTKNAHATDVMTAKPQQFRSAERRQTVN
jgi:hypothetical protein